MLPIRRLYFVMSALFLVLLLFFLVIIETVPFLLYYIFTGKNLRISEELQDKTFSYIENKIDEIAK
jgi:hypothetical protein